MFAGPKRLRKVNESLMAATILRGPAQPMHSLNPIAARKRDEKTVFSQSLRTKVDVFTTQGSSINILPRSCEFERFISKQVFGGFGGFMYAP